MIPEKGGSTGILERLMSSYGVHTQKDLAAALDIAANNISGWTQRDSVPGNVIIKCALDTGIDLQWLVTGEIANASHRGVTRQLSGKPLYDEVMRNGGKLVLQRILNAYGFTMQKQLCELLGISSGTVSTWVRRNYFPGDVVVACALDTGVSLAWLATGKGSQFDEVKLTGNVPAIARKNLSAGELVAAGDYQIDLTLFPHSISEPVYIFSNVGSWIVDESIKNISNGRWLLGIDDKYDIYDISLLPGRKINVSSKGANFTCGVDEVKIAGKVVLTMEYNF